MKVTDYTFYYFKPGIIYDTSKFSSLDWEKWWRDRALMNYNHCKYQYRKSKKGSKEEEYYLNMSRELDRKFKKIDDNIYYEFI